MRSLICYRARYNNYLAATKATERDDKIYAAHENSRLLIAMSVLLFF